MIDASSDKGEAAAGKEPAFATAARPGAIAPPGTAGAHGVNPPPLGRYGALTFSYFAAIGLFNPYAPLWFQSLGFSTLLIGGIVSLQNWTRVVAPYAWSWVGDHGGRRTELIRLAAAGALLAALGLLGVREGVWVALLTTALFLSNSGVVPLYEATLARLLATAQGLDAARYGRVRMWGSVGFLCAVTAFGALLERIGIDAFPWFVVAMNVLLLTAALRLPPSTAQVTHNEPAPPALLLLRQPHVAWFMASIFFTVLAHSGLYAFFSLYLVSLGYGKAAVGGLWAVSVVAEIAFFWWQGRWFPLLRPTRWLKLAAAVAAVRFIAVAAGAGWIAILVAAQALHAVTFAAHHAACITLVDRYFPGRLRGRGQALYTTIGYGFSGVIGGIGGGALISHFGMPAVFWAAAVAALLALACAICAARAARRGSARLG